MMTDRQWEELAIDHETKFLRADICIESPESYTLAEKRAICEDMEASTAGDGVNIALNSVTERPPAKM